MKSYTHFTLSEREYLQELLAKGYSFRKIADFLGRNVSSVSREVNRNKSKYKPKESKNKFWYHCWRAQNLYIRRRRAHRYRALQPGTEEWDFILEFLNRFWSPEAICGRWAFLFPERKKLCVSTIYRYIYRKELPGITAKTHLRRKGKHRRSKDSDYNTIKPDRTIPEWLDIIKGRGRVGDWEGDTVYGGTGKGFLLTLVDRKTRYLRMGLLKNRGATETRRVIEKLLQGLPVKSISLDNGSEFAEFHELEEALQTEVYFAEPHKPWQRGSNENMNGVLRFFFPKGFDFRTVTDEDVQMVEDLINNRPRKCLNWKTPKELFFS